MSLRLEARGIAKSFGGTPALGRVELEVRPGEVHAVLGENGAGKSTLMKILAGALRADAGSMRLDGVDYAPRDTLDARARGVAIVYQEPELCPHLSVAENVLLGDEPARFGLVDRRRSLARVRPALARVALGGEVSPDTLVSRLSPSERQRVALARALAQSDCRVLILDEPTSALSTEDTARLFEVIRELGASGMSVIYISHFLEEVERIAARYSVLRDGHFVASGDVATTPRAELVRLMAGRDVRELFPRSPRTPGEVVLELDALSGRVRPRSASLTLRRGEVLGIAGLLGSGRTELLRAIFGLDPIRSGRIRAQALLGPQSPARRLESGVGMLSEDRKLEGLADALSLADNLTLGRLRGLGPFGLILPERQRAVTRDFIQRLGIRCRGPEQRARELSGGNQQKLLIARLLYADAELLLLDEPTRGIDVGSRAEIYRVIDQLAAQNKAILMVSSYLPELSGICDRIAVMVRGRLGAAHPADGVTEHQLLLEATA